MESIAIASVNELAYSETFIKGQIAALNPRLVLTGRPVATHSSPGDKFSFCEYLLAGIWTSPQVIGSLAGSNSPREKIRKAVGLIQSRVVKARLQRYRINVILANFGPCAVGLLRSSESAQIPLVAHFHGYDAHGLVEVAYYREKYRELGQKAAKVIAVSEHMRNALIEIGIPSDKIALLRYGVNLDKFSYNITNKEKFRFLSVGRFTDKKAPYLVILAFSEVVKIHPNARLIMIGDGHHDEVVRNIAAGICPQGSVEIIGRAEPAKVVEEMQRSTALIQHSICPRYGRSAGDCEGTPVVVLEAMACGLPVIGTRHAGIGEVVEDGKSGILVDERDVQATAKAMLRLAENPDLVESMGNRGRELAVQFYSQKSYHEGLMKIINAVAKR